MLNPKIIVCRLPKVFLHQFRALQEEINTIQTNKTERLTYFRQDKILLLLH